MAKQSLVSKTQTPAAAESPVPTTTPLALPTGGGLVSVTPPDNPTYSNYMAFASPKSPKWATWLEENPGLQPGDAVIVEDGESERVLELVFFLLDVYRYFATLDAEFKPFKAWREKADVPDGTRAREFLSTMLLVMHEGRCIPVTCRFSDAMCAGVYTSVKTSQTDAASPEWGKKSAEHAVTLSISQPNLRFKTKLSWHPRKSKASGFTYYQSSAMIIPTSAADMKVLGSLDEATLEKIDLMKDAFAEHNAGIERLIK